MYHEMLNMSGFDLFFLGDHFRMKSGHRPLVWAIPFCSFVAYVHVMYGQCWAVIKTAHTVHAFAAKYWQHIHHANVLNRTNLCAAPAGSACLGVN